MRHAWMVILCALAGLAVLVPVASAGGHCQDPPWSQLGVGACEEAHHNGAFAGFSGLLAVFIILLSTAIVPPAPAVGPTSPSGPKPAAPAGSVRKPDTGPVPLDVDGEPMTVSDGQSFVDEHEKVVPAGMVWYADPDGLGHWLARADAEARVQAELDAAKRAGRIDADFKRSVFEGYEESKEDWKRKVHERDVAEMAGRDASRAEIDRLGERVRRREELEGDLELAELEQKAAKTGLDEALVHDEARRMTREDWSAIVSYDTAKIVGQSIHDGLAAAHREVTDPENWRVVGEGVRDSTIDAVKLWSGDAETQRRVATNLKDGTTVVLKVGAQMIAHPIETGKMLIGYENWQKAFDPTTPPRERFGRAVYGVADAGLSFGPTVVKAVDKLNDAYQRAKQWKTARAGLRVADGAGDAAEARKVLEATRDSIYAPKTGGPVWTSKGPKGANPMATSREALKAQSLEELDAARRAAKAAGDSGDARRVAAARQSLDEAEANARAMERIAQKPPAPPTKVDAPPRQRGHTDPAEVFDRKQAETAAKTQGRATFKEFKEAEAAHRKAVQRGKADDVARAEARLHKATVDVQRDKNALNVMKNQSDELKGAFNNQLRTGLYDKIDNEVVAGIEKRFGMGKTRYIGEAEPGMKVFMDDKGRRIVLFEPTNPRPGINVGADRDFVVRVSIPDETGKLVTRDVPYNETRALYERALYKHSGAAERWPDKSIDDIIREMDQEITDQLHREAYQGSPKEFKGFTQDPTLGVRDPGQIGAVVSDKSNLWYNRALDHPDRYEEYMAEGMRQSVKQYNNQLAPRIRALEAAGANASVPKDVQQAVRVIEEGLKEGKSTVEIEQALSKIYGPAGAPMNPRLASHRLGETFEALEKLKPPPAPPPTLDLPRVGTALGLASGGPRVEPPTGGMR